MRPTTLVVGAGLAGASVGWHLTSRGESVLLLEQGPFPGAEASAQNAGMFRTLAHDPVERALARRSAALRDGVGDPSGELAWFRRTGGLVALVGEDPALADAAAELVTAGLAEELASPRDVESVAPALAGAAVARAWHLPGDGVVDPHALMQALLRGATQRGAAVRRSRPVTELIVEGARAVGVVCDDGSEVRAERAVVASGAWSGQLAAALGVERPLAPLRRHLLVSAPHPLATREHTWCWLDDAGVYVRPEVSGWLCSPCDERLDPPSAGEGSIGPVEPEARALATDKLERHLPALADVRWTRGWSGLRTFAPDRRPYLGPDPEVEDLWWATGLGGFGVTCCLAAGEVVAAQMGGRTLEWLDVGAVAPGRFASGR